MPDEAKPAPEQAGQVQGETRQPGAPQPTFDPEAFKKELLQKIGDENKKFYGGVAGMLGRFDQKYAAALQQQASASEGYDDDSSQQQAGGYVQDPRLESILENQAISKVARRFGLPESEVEAKFLALKTDPSLQSQYVVPGIGGGADYEMSIERMITHEVILPRIQQTDAAKAEHQRQREEQMAREKSHAFVSGDSAAAGPEVVRPEDLQGKSPKEIFDLYKKAGFPVDEIDPPKY